jgi:hypothetical protein
MSHDAKRPNNEAGLGSVEVLPIGLLVMVTITMLVINAWAIVDAKMGVISAARQAARTTVETADTSRGEAAGNEAWRSTGRSEDISVRLGGTIRRCGRIVATAEVNIPPIPLGFLDTWRPISVRATHSEVVDPYRGKLAGEASC